MSTSACRPRKLSGRWVALVHGPGNRLFASEGGAYPENIRERRMQGNDPKTSASASTSPHGCEELQTHPNRRIKNERAMPIFADTNNRCQIPLVAPAEKWDSYPHRYTQTTNRIIFVQSLKQFKYQVQNVLSPSRVGIRSRNQIQANPQVLRVSEKFRSSKDAFKFAILQNSQQTNNDWQTQTAY